MKSVGGTGGGGRARSKTEKYSTLVREGTEEEEEDKGEAMEEEPNAGNRDGEAAAWNNFSFSCCCRS